MKLNKKENKKMTMKNRLIELLSIHGVSGKERPVRNYLKPILDELMDEVGVDFYGNLLATKKVGNGKGATVLLSAHMDTVRGVEKNRELIIDGNKISSSVGALGADDRAGITIILEVLYNLEHISGFNGVIKVAFSREEEIGCIGSSKIDKLWYSDVDLAIVVDRRGNRDIVVGCGAAFCSNEVGYFFEEVGEMCDMGNWKAIEGGISDAMTFSENGINSVNISAGYYHEHTSYEYVMLNEMKETARLILQAIAVINDFYWAFSDVPEDNEWVASWYKGSGNKYYSYSNGDYASEEEFFDDMVKAYEKDMKNKSNDNEYYDDYIYAETHDEYGDVYICEFNEGCTIMQGGKEIVLTKESLKELFKQLKF